MDPVEYFGWLYGKGFFFHHPYWGAVIVGGVFGLIAFGVSASLWLMGAERYRERHAPTIAQPITPAPAVKASDTVPTVLEKVEPPHSVEPIPSVKPIPRKATPPIIKKDIPVEPKESAQIEPKETALVKPKETIASVLIKKYPVLPETIDINAWIRRIDRVRIDSEKYHVRPDLLAVIRYIGRAPSQGPTVKMFVEGAVSEATLILRCLASEGYIVITETTAQGRWIAIDFPNLEFEFVRERLDEFKEGL